MHLGSFNLLNQYFFLIQQHSVQTGNQIELKQICNRATYGCIHYIFSRMLLITVQNTYDFIIKMRLEIGRAHV